MRTAQTATDFLITYGWSILLIILMIGSLVYLGILKPQEFLVSRCQFSLEIPCQQFSLDDYISSSYDLARFSIVNILSRPITINHIDYLLPEENPYWQSCLPSSTHNITISQNEKQTLNCSMGEFALRSGEKQHLQLRIAYSEGNSYNKLFSSLLYGDIYAVVR